MQRLDVELVRRGLVSSRAEASRAIESGHVLVKGMPATRASTMVRAEDPVSLTGAPERFVSRGGEKLQGALDAFDVEVAGRRWLDAGASTGGFTDCLLQAGAEAVVAADVGYGQLDWRLRNDGRVTVMERINLRYLDRDELPWLPDAIVADLSFISLTTVLPALAPLGAGDMVLLVKPQFEVGRDAVGRTGVVEDPELRAASLERVAAAAIGLGLATVDACASPIKGPAGNVEYFLHLRPSETPSIPPEALARAVTQGEAL